MSARARALLALGLLALALAATTGSAQAFGLRELDSAFLEADESPAVLAGSHPFAQKTTIAFDTTSSPVFDFEVPDGNVKDLNVSLPPGFVGDTTAVPQCSNAAFVLEECPPASQVGVVDATVADPENVLKELPVYNLEPAPGAVAKLGFVPIKVPVTVDLHLNTAPPYNVIATLHNTSNAIPIYGSVLTVFGTPPAAAKPFLTLPRACEGPLGSVFSGSSWEQPGTFTAPQSGASALLTTGCESLGFAPTIAASGTAQSAESPSGLDFDLNFDDKGLTTIGGRAESDLRKAVVTLPAGFTTNPSIASGLAACSLAQYDAEALQTPPGQGCPEASKVGSVTVKSPLIAPVLNGSIFVAKQHDNPFDSLLALYIVIRDPELGILVKQPLKVDPDPSTGQLTSTVSEIPQLPFSNFHLHFRSGPRAPLITPATCATYTVAADLYPYSHPSVPLRRSAEVQVGSAPGGGSCATSPGALPHAPSFSAGTRSPLAGAFSPFVLKLTRGDGSQQLSSLSTTLPQGLLGRLAGIPYCPEAQIAAAQARGGEGQGALELASPSCPAASELGTVTVSSGAGPEPYYVSGKAYLAGPYKGAPLSLEIITPAIAGPFDLGTVAVRTALRIDPETAQVTAVSDPIPTILHGLPLDVRSIAVELARPGFTLNPTGCEPKSITGTAVSTLGASAPLSAYFQASGCRALSFKPKLSLQLKGGGTKRSGHPSLRAVLQMPAGGANISRISVALPHSEFLDQGSIGTICTRVQFAAKTCPARSVYGEVTATSPLVDYAMHGPVYLRSSNHTLPDLVALVKGPASQPIEVASAARIDSIHGGIRTTFESFPDVPITKVVLQMRGGKKKGLLENSRNICAHVNRATVRFSAQNGKSFDFRPALKVKCPKKKKKRHHGHRKGGKGKKHGG